MDRYFTIMLIPEREKGVRSLRIPRIAIQALLFLFVALIFLAGILAYDYVKILRQVYENKHLTIENRQLKEQIQLFQMKINSLTEDLERINTFSKKLRIITGIEEHDLTQSIHSIPDDSSKGAIPINETNEVDGEFIKKAPKGTSLPNSDLFKNLDKIKSFQSDPEYTKLKDLYEQKIATNFGLLTGYSLTKDWSELTKQSFALASNYAEFDFKFSVVKNYAKTLEVDIHQLDQFLLDKNSYLRSTPTLMPTKGWITSYYGPRISPTSQRLRMHEGLDIGAVPGTPIVAPADGRVAYSGVKAGFGNFVQIDHGYGIESFFAHAKSLFVRSGQLVTRGDAIASVGNTGASTGPHLHYEIRVNGTPIDPLFYILD
jgi:murein DD-endopeptidase MepM/ murein hydrolase activator NlpD